MDLYTYLNISLYLPASRCRLLQGWYVVCSMISLNHRLENNLSCVSDKTIKMSKDANLTAMALHVTDLKCCDKNNFTPLTSLSGVKLAASRNFKKD